MRFLTTLVFLLTAGVSASDARDPGITAEIERLDARAADPEQKSIVASVVSDRMKIHRNRLALLRLQTKESYGRIFVAALEKNKMSEAQILQELRDAQADIDKRMAEFRALESNPSPASDSGIRPLALVSTGLDFNSIGTFYSFIPQVGVEWDRGYVAGGVPFYRSSSDQLSAAGVGDAFLSAGTWTGLGSITLGAFLTAGFPTGDSTRGLGAGRVTLDGSGTVSHRFESGRVFFSGGLTNSVFSNVAYQRPYISTGTAAHFSGGIEVRPVRRLTLGGGAFAVRPFGNQTVYSRVIEEPVAQPAEPARPEIRNPRAALRSGRPAVFETVTRTEVTAGSLRDHGPNAWAYVTLHPSVNLHFAVARSLPFHLTTARVGLSFDVVRIVTSGRQ